VFRNGGYEGWSLKIPNVLIFYIYAISLIFPGEELTESKITIIWIVDFVIAKVKLGFIPWLF